MEILFSVYTVILENKLSGQFLEEWEVRTEVGAHAFFPLIRWAIRIEADNAKPYKIAKGRNRTTKTVHIHSIQSPGESGGIRGITWLVRIFPVTLTPPPLIKMLWFRHLLGRRPGLWISIQFLRIRVDGPGDGSGWLQWLTL